MDANRRSALRATLGFAAAAVVLAQGWRSRRPGLETAFVSTQAAGIGVTLKKR